MISIIAILVTLAAAILAGVSGYLISYRFNNSAHAANDKSGDFGTPRGGFFALASGMLVGVMGTSLASHIPGFPGDAAGPSFIASMIVGIVAGFIGMMRGQAAREWGPRDHG